MIDIKVTTQAELEAAIAAGNRPICVSGRFYLSAGMRVVACGNSSVVACGNSSVVARENSSVEAWGNSSVVAWENSSVVARENSSVVAWENSSVVARENSSVVACGNSSVVARENSSVEAWENSSVFACGNSSVVARENSSVVAWGAAIVRLFACRAVVAAAMVTVVIHGCRNRVTGGIQIEVKQPETPREWCEFYGAEISGDTAILFKGVGDDFHSPKGGDYTPGTIPRAPDWDGGKEECGGGYHFSPHPKMTLEFNSNATKFIACPVLLDEIAVHPGGDYPQKVKSPGCCAPCWEVDRNGKRIEATETSQEVPCSA